MLADPAEAGEIKSTVTDLADSMLAIQLQPAKFRFLADPAEAGELSCVG